MSLEKITKSSLAVNSLKNITFDPILLESSDIPEYSTFLYKYISIQYVEEILLAEDVNEVEKILIKHLEFNDLSCDMKEMITLDYYVGAMWFSKQNKFLENQLTAVYILVYCQLKNIENKMSLIDNLIKMRKFFLPSNSTCDIESNSQIENKPSVDENVDSKSQIKADYFYENEFSLEERTAISKLFDTDIILRIFTYMKSNFYQHYKLYEYLFNENQTSIDLNSFMEIELPFTRSLPNPLCEGMTQDDYQLYQDLISADKIQDLSQLKAEPNELSSNSCLEEYLISRLTNAQVQQIISEVFDEVIEEYECSLSQNLDVFKNEFFNKINTMHALKIDK